MSKRRAVTKAIATRHARSDRGAKKQVLDELCVTTGSHRDHARKAETHHDWRERSRRKYLSTLRRFRLVLVSRPTIVSRGSVPGDLTNAKWVRLG